MIFRLFFIFIFFSDIIFENSFIIKTKNKNKFYLKNELEVEDEKNDEVKERRTERWNINVARLCFGVFDNH